MTMRVDPTCRFPDYPVSDILQRTIFAWTSPADVRFIDARHDLHPSLDLRAGGTYDFTIRLALLRDHLRPSGRIACAIPMTWTAPVDGDGPGSVTPPPSFDVSFERSENIEWYIVLTRRGPALPPLREISFLYSRATIQSFAQAEWGNWRGSMVVFVDPEGEGRWGVVPRHARTTPRILANPAARLLVTADTHAVAGEPFTVKASALDWLGNSADPPVHDLLVCARRDRPFDLLQEASMNGSHAEFSLVEAEAGDHRYVVRSRSGSPAGLSNYVRVRSSSARGPRVFFGDLHAKTNVSDGLGSPDDFYRTARNVSLLDFAAIADHNGFEATKIDQPRSDWMSEDAFAGIQDAGDRWNRDNDFATLIASEDYLALKDIRCSHRNTYYPTSGQSLFRGESVRELLAQARRKGAIVVPHHTLVWTGNVDEYGEDTKDLLPVIEIYSQHGSAEYRGNPFSNKPETGTAVDELLSRGCRFGFIASSDNHSGTPGLSPLPSRFTNLCYPAGLAAIRAETLSRSSVFEAILTRACYATTGVRIILDFTVNGHPMGSEIEAESPDIAVAGEVLGTSPVVAVEVIRNGASLRRWEPVRETFSFDFTDRIDADCWYYLRVVQDDLAMAWSSPIWVVRGDVATGRPGTPVSQADIGETELRCRRPRSSRRSTGSEGPPRP